MTLLLFDHMSNLCLTVKQDNKHVARNSTKW